MKNINIKKIISGFVMSFVLMCLVGLPFLANAQPVTDPTNPIPSTYIPNPLTKADPTNKMTLLDLLQTVLKEIVMPIAAVVSVVYIIWAGFKYVTAQGNEKAIQEAHQNLLWALVGVGVLLGATGISMVIQKTVGALIN